MLNIRQLAQQLGVSPATVSLALNHKKGVSPALARKIREQAFELGYYRAGKQGSRPNAGTRMLSVRVLQVVKHGHILGEHHQSFIDGYIMGMMQYAMQQKQRQNVQLEVQTLHWNGETNKDALYTQTRQSGLGYIVIATELEADELDALTRALNRPVVFIDAIYDHLPYDFIDMNNTDVIYEIVRHLVQQKRQTLSFVGSKQNTPNFYQRESALETACDYYDVELKRRYSIDPYEDPDATEMKGLLQKYELPQALICANDYIAYNCIKALQSLKYRIPQDAAVIGFDNLPASPLFQPSLSSVEIPKQEIGRLALSRLLSIMNETTSSERESITKQKLSCRFIPRASSVMGSQKGTPKNSNSALNRDLVAE